MEVRLGQSSVRSGFQKGAHGVQDLAHGLPWFVEKAHLLDRLPTAHEGRRRNCQRPSKAAQVWPSKIAHLAEVTSL